MPGKASWRTAKHGTVFCIKQRADKVEKEIDAQTFSVSSLIDDLAKLCTTITGWPRISGTQLLRVFEAPPCTEGWEQFKPKVKNQSHNYHSVKVYTLEITKIWNPRNSKFDRLKRWEIPLFCSSPLPLHSVFSWQKCMHYLYTQVFLQHIQGIKIVQW